MQAFQGRLIRKQIEWPSPKEKNKLKEFIFVEKRRKTKLNESYYEAIFRRSRDGIVVINEKGIVVDFNRAFIDMLGYKPQDLKKSRFRKLTPNIYSYLDKNAYRQLLEKGYYNEYEKELTKKDGTRVPICLSGAIFASREDDRRWYTFAIIRDLTDRKQMEEQLLINKRAIDAANDGIIITDSYKLHNPIIYANAAFYSTTQYTPKSIRGGNISILEGEKTDPETKNAIRSALRNGRYFTCEILHYRRDKTTFWNEITLSPVYDANDKLSNYIMIQKEITERKQHERELIKAKEEAEKSNKVKSLFLANMSHEIRTPLNSIMGFTELLEKNTRHLVGKEEKSFFDMIKISGNRLLRTVHEILDISQVEAGTYKLDIIEVDLNKLVKSLVDIYQPMAREKNLDLKYKSDLDSAMVQVDKYGVSQAINNLIDNAIKYTERGKIEVLLKETVNHYILLIQDTGIGMSEDYIRNLFQTFSQESVGYTKKYQGIGLGLALTKHYLELNRINLEVESRKGEGSRFKLIFDRRQVLTEKPKVKNVKKTAKTMETSHHTPKGKPLVLVVDDDENSQKLISFYVKSKFETEFAVSVEEAKAVLKKVSPEIILLDLSLVGDEDGLDLVRYIRKSKTWEDIPVIVTTAHAFTVDRKNSLQAGCSDYLTKPLKKKELLEKLEEWIS